MHEDEPIDSAACFAHLLVDGQIIDPQAAKDVARFRRAERQRLYAIRLEQTREQRRVSAQQISRVLKEKLAPFKGQTIALYWPIRGEIDLRALMAEMHRQGAIVVLPVVIKKNEALEFHRWQPNSRMIAGFWNIPIPEKGVAHIPNSVIVPLLGVDEAQYRLGNGGGYYDRTLARLPKNTRVIGVGSSNCQMKTIFAQPWDIPMGEVVLSE